MSTAMEAYRIERSLETARVLLAVECVAISRGVHRDNARAVDRAQRSILEALQPGVTLSVDVSKGFSNRALPSCRFVAHTDRTSPPDADSLQRAALLAALRNPALGFHMAPATDERHIERPLHSRLIQPASYARDLALPTGLVGFHPVAARSMFVRVPSPPARNGGEMDRLLAILSESRGAIGVRCELRRVSLPRPMLRRLCQASGSAFVDTDYATELRVTVVGNELITDDVAALVGLSLFGTPSQGAQPNVDGADDELPCLFPDIGWIPTLLPSPRALIDHGYSVFPVGAEATVDGDDVAIGRASGASSLLVRLSHADRAGHCHLLGATGVGKSTVMLNMIDAELRDGRGLCLIDPHGDLFDEVVRRVPASRAEDVVIIDPYDADYAVGINVLEYTGDRQDVGSTTISNALVATFDRLYDLQKTGGPVFEIYLRNAVMLVMASAPSATIVDVVRVFEDRSYRNHLVERCDDVMIQRFWRDQAEKAGGELALNNVAPYITSKLNQFTHNRLVMPIVAQARSTVRFDRVLRNRSIVLVNLAVGQLGWLDSRFIGMLILDKLFEAAVACVGARRADRRPFRIFIDEFPDFAGPTLEAMLSAGRKFGLSLVLANQTLSQLRSARYGRRLEDAVTSNIRTRLVFRLGGYDAARLSRELGTGISSEQLRSLPDFHAACVLTGETFRQAPLILETLPAGTPVGPLASYDDLLALRSRYATPYDRLTHGRLMPATV